MLKKIFKAIGVIILIYIGLGILALIAGVVGEILGFLLPIAAVIFFGYLFLMMIGAIKS